MKRAPRWHVLAVAEMLCAIGLLSLLARDSSGADALPQPVASSSPGAASPTAASAALSPIAKAVSSDIVMPISANPGASPAHPAKSCN